MSNPDDEAMCLSFDLQQTTEAQTSTLL
jgi:hypothetical protein